MTPPASQPAESESRFFPPVSEGQTVAGKYLVGPLLGLGGMGAVHSARDLSLDRRVALKVLLPRLVTSKTASERFLREARAATRITSEHVVKLLESSTLPDGTPLLVMEYLEGRDLRAVLREDGPLEPRLAVDYLLQALQAIAEGHTQRIVHRDVKPSNLFLTRRADGTPLIKVLDFGIAKTLEPSRPDDFALTSSEDVQLGSPTYMPPEQFQSPSDVDARADIWALGVTLYEMISGTVPFRGQGYIELVSKVLSATPDSLAPFLAKGSLPRGLEKVIFRCLAKDRERRYRDAAELAAALAPFGSDDARLSLTRVAGLSRHLTATPLNVSVDLGGYEATLPVANDAARSPSSSVTVDLSGRAHLSGANKRPRIALGMFAMAAACVAAVWFLARPVTSRAAGAPAFSSSVEQGAPALADARLVGAPKTLPSDLPAAPAQPSVVLPSPKAVVFRLVPHAASSGLSAGGAPLAAPSASERARAAEAAPSASGLGPSALIEKLIEHRH